MFLPSGISSSKVIGELMTQKYINEYLWFERCALLFIPLAFANVLFGDVSLGLGGGLLWTVILLWIRSRNQRARIQRLTSEG